MKTLPSIHERARALSAQRGIPLEHAYAELSRRGAEARRRRRGFADYGRVTVKPGTLWWMES